MNSLRPLMVLVVAIPFGCGSKSKLSGEWIGTLSLSTTLSEDLMAKMQDPKSYPRGVSEFKDLGEELRNVHIKYTMKSDGSYEVVAKTKYEVAIFKGSWIVSHEGQAVTLREPRMSYITEYVDKMDPFSQLVIDAITTGEKTLEISEADKTLTWIDKPGDDGIGLLLSRNVSQ